VLRVEMASTGEVAAFGKTYDEALLKSILSANSFDFSKSPCSWLWAAKSIKPSFWRQQEFWEDWVTRFLPRTRLRSFLQSQGVACEKVRKASQQSPNFLDIVESKQVAFVVNLSQVSSRVEQERVKRHLTDGFRIRRAAVDNQIPLFTDLHLARAFVKALEIIQLINWK